MPRIIDYSPPWLARPSPGASFFTPTNDKTSTQSTRPANGRDSDDMPQGRPKRILARRGAEIFAVVDNQIRWANLSTLKDEWKKGAKQRIKDSSNEKENGTTDRSKDSSLSRPIPREDASEHENTSDEEPLYYRVWCYNCSFDVLLDLLTRSTRFSLHRFTAKSNNW